MNNLELSRMANEVRKGIITAVHGAKAGHPGGSLSAADIFTFLYFEEMNIYPADPKKADRDRFVLSKGHTAPGLYSALAHRGYFPVEDLPTLRHLGSYLQGHPCMQEVPYLVDTYATYHDKGLEIYGVSLDQNADDWKEALSENKMTWTNVMADGDAGKEAQENYAIQSIPSNFLIGPDGKIVARNLRGDDLKAKISELLDK